MQIGLMLLLLAAPETSKIDSVVVFADRAKVTRAMSVECKDGVAGAVFEPLPYTLDVRTLRGEAKGGTAIGVSSSELSRRSTNRNSAVPRRSCAR